MGCDDTAEEAGASAIFHDLHLHLPHISTAKRFQQSDGCGFGGCVLGLVTSRPGYGILGARLKAGI